MFIKEVQLPMLKNVRNSTSGEKIFMSEREKRDTGAGLFYFRSYMFPTCYKKKRRRKKFVYVLITISFSEQLLQKIDFSKFCNTAVPPVQQGHTKIFGNQSFFFFFFFK